MTRWSLPRPVRAARGSTGSPAGEAVNTVDERPWIEWVVLLEHYLRHPTGKISGAEGRAERPATIRYRVEKGDSLASLEGKFRSDAFDPKSFTWIDIADANFPTAGLAGQARARVINRELRRTGRGALCADKVNYAFKPGIEILIPLRRWKVPAAAPADPRRAWWRFVMLHGWEVLRDRRRFEDHPDGPLVHHVPLPVSGEDLQKIIDRGRGLLEQGEDSYVP
jgi:hypothetical protein